MESKIVEIKGKEGDNFYKMITLVSYTKCSEEEQEIFGVKNKRNHEGDISLYLFKIKLEDGGHFYKLDHYHADNFFFNIISNAVFFSDEAKALDRAKSFLLNYKK